MDIFPFYRNNDTEVYLFILPPYGVNTYVVMKNNTIIVVDPGKGNDLLFNSIDLGKYHKKGILITHTHYDHIVGLKEYSDFEIMIPEKDENGLIDPSANLSYMFSEDFKLKIPYKELYEGYYDFGEFKFLASYYPGHTPGSMIYDFGDFIFTGDFIFLDSIGRTDLPYGDEETMFHSLEKFRDYLKTKKDSVLIMPGHMNICTVKDLKDNNVFLKYGGKK